ncbi:hypothetical protein NKG94_49245 [Micromonospora sp. M12]
MDAYLDALVKVRPHGPYRLGAGPRAAPSPWSWRTASSSGARRWNGWR